MSWPHVSSKPKELESFISCLLNYPNGNILCLVHVNSIKEYIIFDTTLKKKKDMQNSTIFALLCESKTVPKWEVKTKYMGRFATANNTKPKICVNFIKQTKRRTNEIILQIMLSSPIFTSPVRGRQVPIKRKAHGLSWTVHCPSDFWGGVFNLSKPLLPPSHRLVSYTSWLLHSIQIFIITI